jgi:hypothetical protein
MNRLLMAVALVAGGCGSSTPGAPDAAVAVPDAGPYLYRTCDPVARVGGFKIHLDEAFTAVSGVISSGVAPRDVPVVAGQAGDCRLLRGRNLSCASPCDSQSTCGEEGKCIPAPVGRGAGTIRISGLSAPVTMTPNQLGQHYDYTMLPHPGFQPGAEVVLWAAGGEVGPFLLQGRGVAPVELDTDKPLLEPGKDFQLRWKPGPAGPAHVVLQIEIDQHGTNNGSLQCDVPDQGAVTVGAALIDELIKLGTSGFARIAVTRRTADAVMSTEGCVELEVLSAVERPLAVAGHTPCNVTADCPTGKTCATAIHTCR